MYQCYTVKFENIRDKIKLNELFMVSLDIILIKMNSILLCQFKFWYKNI